MHLFNNNLIVAHLVQAFSWMLIHSLWQGLLLAIITATVLLVTKKSSAAVRYNLVTANFLLFIVSCTLTFIWEWDKSSLQHAVPNVIGVASPMFKLSVTTINQFYATAVGYFSANAPMVVLLWFIFFVFKSLKMVHGLVYIQRAKNKYTYEPASHWKNRVDMLCEKLQLKRTVHLLESGYVKMPMVIGYLKPIILIPMGLLNRLPADQIEAILLHELAHIRRHDYVVNFLQTITETIFFFNPGLLWMSVLLRDERENCCDDIALAQTNNKKEFIQALISFKEYSLYGANYTVAFPGKKNQLLDRVSRILHNKNKTFGIGEKMSFMAGIITLLAIMATAAIGQVSHIKRSTLKENSSVTFAAVQHINTPVKVQDTVFKAKRKVRSNTVSITHAKKKVTTIKVPKKQVEQAQLKEQESAELDVSRESSNQLQGRRDQLQARLEQAEARRYEADARRSREEAMNDQVKAQAQARRDQAEARRDQHQARLDQEEAMGDQAQARRDQAQAKRDLAQARRDLKQARQNQ